MTHADIAKANELMKAQVRLTQSMRHAVAQRNQGLAGIGLATDEHAVNWRNMKASLDTLKAEVCSLIEYTPPEWGDWELEQTKAIVRCKKVLDGPTVARLQPDFLG